MLQFAAIWGTGARNTKPNKERSIEKIDGIRGADYGAGMGAGEA
jgi:hypothetical protein